MFKEHCFLRSPDFGPNDGRYDVTRLLCVRLSQLRQSLRRDPPSAVLSNNATTARTIGIGGPGRTLVSSRWPPMRNQIDHVRADRRRGFCELTTTQAEFRITSEPSGRGQVEPRAIKQPFRQQSSRDRKAEQFEAVAVGDVERLGRLPELGVGVVPELFFLALGALAPPLDVEVAQTKILLDPGDLRNKAKLGGA